MLWLAVKLRRETRLGSLDNPTILVVTDRVQLDRQITATFENSSFPAPEQASAARDLRQLLTTGAGRTVMTTVQKFEAAMEGSGGRGGRPPSGAQRGGDGGRGAPHPVRDTGRPDVPGLASGRSHRLHRHPHRQGLPPQHHGQVRAAHRLLHHPPVGGGPVDGSHPLRAAQARAGGGGRKHPRPAVRRRLRPPARSPPGARISRRYANKETLARPTRVSR